MTTKLAEFNFGEYEGRREYLRSNSYFLESFKDPISFSLSTLKASKNFLLVGRKGSGKTACQMYLQNKLSLDGYVTGEIVFFRDIQSNDYVDFARSQSSIVDITKITPGSDISLMYDFRSVWRRIIFIKLANILHENQIDNKFSMFCLGTTKGTSSILDGLKKGLSVEINIPMGFLDSKFSFDASKISNSIPISQFNSIAEKLLIEELKGNMIYLFVDELVISSLNTQGDEYRIRVALIRDLIKTSSDLNDVFVKHGLDINIILSIRPEVRHRINYMDAEIGKILDGNDVLLHWDFPDNSKRHPLIEIMYDKIERGSPKGEVVSAREFVDETISFMNKSMNTENFFLNNSWYRPRDMVRYLKSFAKICPGHNRITADTIKSSLNEYSRVSAKELTDELSVMLPESFVNGISRSIKKNKFNDLNELCSAINYNKSHEIDDNMLGQTLFELGMIGNISDSGDRYFSAHRQEEELKPDRTIQIHPGLWNFFNTRSA